MLLPGSDGHVPEALAAPSDADALPQSRLSLVRVLAAAPALSAAVGHDPLALDCSEVPLPVSAGLTGEEHLRAWYRACRQAKHQIATRLLLGDITAAEAGRAYSDLADAAIADIMRACAEDFVAAHGRIREGRHAVVAIGRLGARELTISSDLDLLLLYECGDRAALSDGAQPLPGCQYYVRLAQRLIAALSCNCGEGPLFAVDFRLRPWGSKGPIATRIASLRDYFATEAWTFEAMAFTRARVVTASRGFGVEAEAALRAAIVAVGRRADVRADAAEMRRMVQREKASRRVWDIKCVAGGLMDVDFIVHTLAIEHVAAFAGAPMHDMPGAIARLADAGALARGDAALLTSALALYQTAIQHLRIALPAPWNARTMPDELAAILTRACGCADFAELEQRMRATQRAVRGMFEAVVVKARVAGKRVA